MCGDCFLQRQIVVSVVPAINFESFQIDWQFTKRKRSNAARCEIESRTALRLGPMHVIGMLVSHTALGKFCCPRTTLIDTKRRKLSHDVLFDCRASSYRFSSSAVLNPKRHENVSHSESFAKLSRKLFTICVHLRVSWVKNFSKNNKL